MDQELKLTDSIEPKPIDELGSLDDQLDDLMFTAERAAAQRQRFALLVDATSSMGSHWARAKEALRSAVDVIKRDAKVPIQISVVAYRDHIDDPKKYVVEYSDWSDDSDYLYNYINSMRCHGGGDYPESIGHGLAYLLSQQYPISQIILIGDAPSKEGSLGYHEAETFGKKGCPIYALYTQEEHNLVECFQKLAKLSGGKAMFLEKYCNLSDIFKVLLASNKVLGIEYIPESTEGQKLKGELK